jgi:hypothetical protein
MGIIEDLKARVEVQELEIRKLTKKKMDNKVKIRLLEDENGELKKQLQMTNKDGVYTQTKNTKNIKRKREESPIIVLDDEPAKTKCKQCTTYYNREQKTKKLLEEKETELNDLEQENKQLKRKLRREKTSM